MTDIPVRLHTDEIDLARDSVPATAGQAVPCKGWLYVRNTSRHGRAISVKSAAGQPVTLPIARRSRREKHTDVIAGPLLPQPVTYSSPDGLRVLVVTLPQWLTPCPG